MARIRYIKPEAFTDEDLGSLPPVVRWFYTGLWTQADCEGLLEDKPRELKAKLIPYDNESGEECLDLLAKHHKVVRYISGAKRYIWIPTLKEHQKFHKDEKARGLPPPATEIIDNYHNNGASTLSAPCQHRVENTLTETLTETLTLTETETGNGDGELEREVVLTHLPAGAGPPQPPVTALQELWNKTAHPSLPRWEEMPEARKKRAKRALRERPILSWLAVIQRINRSSFCLGSKGWAASVDWMLKPGNAAKILEGDYDDKTGPEPPRDVRKGVVRAEDMDHETNEVDEHGNIAI